MQEQQQRRARQGILHAFSAAKYCKKDHIAQHDDRAYTPVKLDNGRIITTSRTLAVIYYLTRDWREEYGGVLVDLEDPTAPPGEGRKVPRYHAVTAMTTDRPRYSIFGWFLEPGKLYELYTGKEEDDKRGGAGDRQAAAVAQPANQTGAQRKGPALSKNTTTIITTDDDDDDGNATATAATIAAAHAHGQAGGRASGRGRGKAAGPASTTSPDHVTTRTTAAPRHGVPQKKEQEAPKVKAERRQRTGAKRQREAAEAEGDVAAQHQPGPQAAAGAPAGTVTRGKLRLPGRWQGRRKHACVG
ncbi:hypothetical protein VOLCADRAFT_120381 [Volvox carteri f. nagariensis]|uniref:Prolyl 4-hydroxylase alpha subunit Fe(2+) 2OG dioxygenase domain-containing protein n=1 Tax=Volvox carteri f. nagariensis TaxID=3068 RepID=D8TK00_VOLCA|nr:uncharacterized protein VOLCADRAFT_120381 [Volvox carteri f. nagariensis]EFJ52159.1 hypothetical protein VOLCADRAFT_120381 [Volvox carteri f. nagariensis]|eukprot:XP_002946933.1 hypothetical protein VOLCADRAFT_120381 [Volvox carteri f. nagariensis]